MGLFSFLLGSSCAFHPEMKALGSQDFEHTFKTRKVFSILVDCRAEDRFEQGHLPGAVHMPLSEDFLSNLDEVLAQRNAPKRVLLFVYAEDEAATREMLDQLSQKGKSQHKITLMYYLEKGYQSL